MCIDIGNGICKQIVFKSPIKTRVWIRNILIVLLEKDNLIVLLEKDNLIGLLKFIGIIFSIVGFKFNLNFQTLLF